MLGLTQGLGATWHGLEVAGHLPGEHSPKEGRPGVAQWRVRGSACDVQEEVGKGKSPV